MGTYGESAISKHSPPTWVAAQHQEQDQISSSQAFDSTTHRHTTPLFEREAIRGLRVCRRWRGGCGCRSVSHRSTASGAMMNTALPQGVCVALILCFLIMYRFERSAFPNRTAARRIHAVRPEIEGACQS